VADSAASRARVAEGRDTPPPVARAAPTESRRGRRTALVLVTLLVLVAAGALATYAYVRSQYYVGLDDDHVVVFRGVKGSVAGVALQSVQERSTLGAERLTDVERSTLEDGIVAHDARDAHAIVQRLISAACPTPVAVPTPKATVRPSASPAPAPSPTPCP
jgi:protein phosphatase